MRTEQGKIEGDLVLEDGLQLQGMVTGNTNVKNGGTLELRGTCLRNLFLEEGAEVQLYGTVVGSVTNRGGRLLIYGVVKGDVRTLAGETWIDPKAVIEGKVQDDT